MSRSSSLYCRVSGADCSATSGQAGKWVHLRSGTGGDSGVASQSETWLSILNCFVSALCVHQLLAPILSVSYGLSCLHAMQALDPAAASAEGGGDIPLAPNFQPLPAFVPSCDLHSQESRWALPSRPPSWGAYVLGEPSQAVCTQRSCHRWRGQASGTPQLWPREPAAPERLGLSEDESIQRGVFQG